MSIDIYAIKVPIKAVYDNRAFWFQNPNNVRDLYDIDDDFFEFGPNRRPENRVLNEIGWECKEKYPIDKELEEKHGYDYGPFRICDEHIPKIEKAIEEMDEYAKIQYEDFLHQIKDLMHFIPENVILKRIEESQKELDSIMEVIDGTANNDSPYAQCLEPVLYTWKNKYDCAIYDLKERLDAGGCWAIYLRHV